MLSFIRSARTGLICCLVCAGVVQASDAWVEFHPPLEITLRNKNRSVQRGGLLRFDHDKVIVDMRARGVPEPRPVHVKLNQIASIRSENEEFMYLAGDDLDGVIRSARKIEGAQIVGLSFADDPEPPASPASKPESTKPDDTRPEANSAGASPPTEMRRPDFDVVETVICGNCNKEVRVSSKHGQKCPHCGIEWALPVAIPKVAATPAPGDTAEAAGDAMGEARPAGRVQHGQAAQPQGGPHPANVPPPPAPNMGLPEDMNFANLPLWMKASLFIGSIAVMYYLFFVRR